MSITKTNILLNNCKWKVKGFWPYVPILKKGMELGNEMMGVTDWIDASVPGGVHKDLLNARSIEDPYFDKNSLKCEWVENRWWMYKTTFNIEKEIEGKQLTLLFKGIDYLAHFYLNSKELGTHEGMYEHVSFDISDQVKVGSENELIVLLENAPEEMHQIGYTSRTRTQKSRFNYKWDFSTRLVNIGIWDDVLIKINDMYTLEDTFIRTDIEDNRGIIDITAGIKGKSAGECTVAIKIEKSGALIEVWSTDLFLSPGKTEFRKKFTVKNPDLWFPNGLGDQPLYKVTIGVYQSEKLSDKQVYNTGIRKIAYRKNIGSSADSLPYTIVINDTPVYIKGVNIVPFDHLYGNVSNETYDNYVKLIVDANINLVRIWGGGIIEKEYFYNLCDQKGIMVWQEFIQSSSGIENVPSTDPHFLRLLKGTAIQVVKDKRNHVCHSIWSGGNELMDENNIPITMDNPNISMLNIIVNTYDRDKLFLPSSSSGPNEFLNIDNRGANHDVHGNWKYEGLENHYKIFNESDSLLHSEFGVDGCCSTQSMKKFLSEDNIRITDMKENLIWRHHGEWWDTLERDTDIFGGFESLEQFVKASQFIQAEGIRYALEANRRRMFQNSGSIVWQFNEPWPNVSCTSMVDYYRNPKLAYYFMKDAFRPVNISLGYDRLLYKRGDDFRGQIFVNNDFAKEKMAIEIEILNRKDEVLYSLGLSAEIKGNTTTPITEFNWDVPDLTGGFYVSLLVNRKDSDAIKSTYLFLVDDQGSGDMIREVERYYDNNSRTVII